MAKHFKPDWPALARLTSKLEQSQKRLDEETAAMASSARSSAEGSYRAARERERNLQTILDTQKRAAVKLSIDSIEYTNLRSEVTKKRETLNELLKRQSEITLSSHIKDTRQSNTRIIDPATPPRNPWRPNKKVNLMLGLLTGIGLGAGLAFAIEYLDNTVKSAEEIRRYTGYAAIGIIPEHRASGPRPMRRGASVPETNADLVTHEDPRSQLAEAYKELRTSTLLASPDQPPRTILVTSCLPQEGKSQTSLNLAIALAQAGKRVLLVDADLRRPRLHKALGLDNERGLSTYLSGNSPVETLVRATDVPDLDLLTSGPIPPNPSELLGSRNFLALVQEFAESGGYDHLIFDSPPLLSVADPIVVATVLDGTILVVQSGQTPRDAMVRGAGKLHHANVKVLGAVLNSVTDGDRSYYYRSRYRYESDAGDEPRADAGG
jgi:capsular exopolysaccharide synthesis family protein